MMQQTNDATNKCCNKQMLQQTNDTTNKCYNKQMLQQTNATTNKAVHHLVFYFSVISSIIIMNYANLGY